MTKQTQLNNILIIRTDRIGDVVLTTPVFKALRQAYPHARIAVMVTPATVDLVKGNPYIDQVMVDDRKGRHHDLFGFLRLAREIRQGNFDAVFIFHTKRRYNLACYMADVPMRIGYQNNKFGFLLTHPLKDERPSGKKHEAQYCLDVLSSVGVKASSLDLFLPVQKEAEAWGTGLFQQHGLQQGAVIAIHPGASDPTKCWPTLQFAKLIESLLERYAVKVILVGGPDAVGLAHDIVRQSPNANLLDLTGKTSVAQTVAVLRRCRLLISNDSGPVHVAAAVGINVISLFLRHQAGINPLRWKPLGDKSYVLTNKEGEEITLDQKGKIAAGKLDSILKEDVLTLIESIFQKDTQNTFHW